MRRCHQLTPQAARGAEQLAHCCGPLHVISYASAAAQAGAHGMYAASRVPARLCKHRARPLIFSLSCASCTASPEPDGGLIMARLKSALGLMCSGRTAEVHKPACLEQSLHSPLQIFGVCQLPGHLRNAGLRVTMITFARAMVLVQKCQYSGTGSQHRLYRLSR